MNKRITGLLTALTIAATPIALPARAADIDPAYRVYMARDGTSYTAEVTLENIAATYGTFGIYATRCLLFGTSFYEAQNLLLTTQRKSENLLRLYYIIKLQIVTENWH
ncbi:MAG: hypothetical protein IJI39_07055 [Clostridia bacterium]|nr:hypothetical protein [Clostridia bacterium]